MGTTPQIIDFRERLNHVNALKGQQSTTQGDALGISNQIMSQSLSKIYLHIIFHIKTTSPSIKEEHLERVHSYIGQLVNTTGCQTLIVGGVSNHVHIVCQLSKNETVSHLLEEVKRSSSRWIKTIDDRYRHFAWQGGYATFSISESVLPKTINYVKNQKAHHAKSSFRKEYLDFLKHYKVEYDERYVLSD